MSCCNEYETCDENPKCMFKFGVYPPKKEEPLEKAWVDDMIWLGMCALVGGLFAGVGLLIYEVLR